MLTLVKLDKTQGKTVKAAHIDNDAAAIVFTDGTFTIIEPETSYEVAY